MAINEGYPKTFIFETPFKSGKFTVKNKRQEDKTKKEIRKKHTYNHPRVMIIKYGYKVGRNDSCPCGSGKKFKHCCGVLPTITFTEV